MTLVEAIIHTPQVLRYTGCFRNYFDYDYPTPALTDPEPFTISLWATAHVIDSGMHLVRVGIQGAEPTEKKPANLVFLVDVSGSMAAPSALLPPILPVVLHHSKVGWTGPTRMRDLIAVPARLPLAFDPFIPDFAFVLDDLSKLDDVTLRARALTELARVTLLVMQRCRDAPDPVAILRPWSHALVAVLTAPHGASAMFALAS